MIFCERNIFPLDLFTKVGKSMIYHDKKQMTIKEAKERCKSLDSALVEFWTDEEWKEVRMIRNFMATMY